MGPSPFLPLIVCSPHSSAVKPATEYPNFRTEPRAGRSGQSGTLCEIRLSATVSNIRRERLPGKGKEEVERQEPPSMAEGSNDAPKGRLHAGMHVNEVLERSFGLWPTTG